MHILVINSGSSNLKLAIYTHDADLKLLYKCTLENIGTAPCLTIFNASHKQILQQILPLQDLEGIFYAFLNCIKGLPEEIIFKAVGHRVVHGGKYFCKPSLIDDAALCKIVSLTPLAPYHQPASIQAIAVIKKLYPNLPQVACFDTTFHQTQEKLATLFAIPRKLTEDGVIRYGFHGISYAYIASVMNTYLGNIGNKRVIVAHLGNGASMCAMLSHTSIATSMGFTALDGLMMGTRCGTLDPGVILYLLQEKKWSLEQVSNLVYKESGLLGVSGISMDMRELQFNPDPNAMQAVDLFCYIAAKELTALCSILQGCDAIIFTAGIGEKSFVVREKICERLQWLGVMLDKSANVKNARIISQATSKILVAVIPTNEEYMIAKFVNETY